MTDENSGAVRLGKLRRWGIICTALIALVIATWQGLRYWQRQQDEKLLVQCRIALKTEDIDRLESLAMSWRSRDSSNAYPLLFLAEVARRHGEFSKAVQLLGEIPSTATQAPAAYVEKAKLEFGEDNQVLDGVATCKKLLELEPRSPDAHALLISFYAMTFQRTALLAQIREAIKYRCEPRDSYVYLIISDNLVFPNARKVIETWRVGAPDSNELHLAWALQLAKHANQLAASRPSSENLELNREAIFQINAYLERFPEHQGLLEHKILLAVDRGDIAEIEQLLARVSWGRETDYMLWRYRGWYHAAKNELEESAEAYSQALAIYPLSWQVRFEYSGVLRRLRRETEYQQNEKTSLIGKQVHQEVIRLANTRDASNQLLERVADYANLCGETAISEALRERLNSKRSRDSNDRR